MSGRKHFFIALASKGWGEISTGVEVARQLRVMGDKVSFMVGGGDTTALSGTDFDVQQVPEHIGPLIGLLLKDRLAHEDFTSIVVCDFVTTDFTLRRFGVDPRLIFSYDRPVIAIDTWDYHVTGSKIDIFDIDQWDVGTWMEDVNLCLVPVPIGRPTARGAFCRLSSPKMVTHKLRRQTREKLGLSAEERAVLFCTAGWQHEIGDPDRRRLVNLVPQLLWTYLAQVSPAVRLIHVGPESLQLKAAGDRYLWIPSMTRDDFDQLLGGIDLLLSVNVPATTLGRAMTTGVPVLAVQNSFRAQAISEIEPAIERLSSNLRLWLDSALPLYRFLLWPLGFWDFLSPLLRDNPYFQALELVELLDETGFVETCRRLLFDDRARDELVARQAAYTDQAMQMPTAAQVVETFLR